MHLTAVDDAAWASPWRRESVGAKVALGLGLVLTALLAPAWPGTLLVAVASIVAILGPARIPARVLATVMVAPLLFVAAGAASVLVSLGTPVGATWWRLGPLSVGPTSLHQALGLLGHGIAGALGVMVLATTTPMSDLLDWLQRRHMPSALVEVAGLTYRLLWVLLATTLSIREAQAARLGDAAGFGRRLSMAGDAMGQVLVRSWDRARRLEDGLAGRGHEGELRTLPRDPAPASGFLMATACCLALIWVLALAPRLLDWQVTR